MKVVCYGDSNTFGYDPRSFLGGRYDADSRWVDLLARRTGWEVLNRGMNGREIPGAPVPLPAADLLIVMLGVNDLLQGRSPEAAAQRMERFLTGLPPARGRLLLIAPPPLAFGEWVQEQRLIDASAELARRYRALAGRLGIRFLDAGAWQIELAYDGVHFTGQGHRAFARWLAQELAGEG